jgi:glycosyltransferase involved in cell wall biosynthesis
LVTSRKRLLFVSPRFLFPADEGGKIRTLQILRGMKGGQFEVTVISPATADAKATFSDKLNTIADHFFGWPQKKPSFGVTRLKHLASRLPIPVETDRSKIGRSLVARELAKTPDAVVFDFVHSAVLAPDVIGVPSIMFTHNVEAEIFGRHAENANNWIMKAFWRNQLGKMEVYERACLRRFDKVITVSGRDKQYFEANYGISNVSVTRTGVDLGGRRIIKKVERGGLVFTGPMDWLANRDAIQYFMDDIWPQIISHMPALTLSVVGRSPPAHLRKKAQTKGWRWEFTGYVRDVRPYVQRACAYVIPLRVGGGTRIKVFEAMAMGCPVVSTSIGVEGLPLEDGKHYLRADTPSDFAAAVVRLLNEKGLRERLSREARRYIEENFASARVAKEFEDICLHVINAGSASSSKATRRAKIEAAFGSDR